MSVRFGRVLAPALAALAVGALASSLDAQGKTPAGNSPAPTAPAASATKPGAVTPPAMPPAVKKAAAQFDAALKLHQARKIEAAMAAYKVYLQLAAQAHLSPVAFVPAYKNLASLYDARHDFPNEIQMLRLAARIVPDDASTLTQLAALMQAQKNFPEARAYALHALALNPPPNLAAALHFTLGGAYAATRDWTRAETEFATTVTLVPNNALAQYNYALTLGQRKKYPQALAVARKALKLAPQLTQAKLFIASLQQQEGHTADAIATYEEALQAEPKNETALFNRALLLQKAGRVDDAIAAYNAVEALNPKDAGAQINLGQIYYGIANYTAARKHFAQAVELLPRDDRAYVGLASSEMQYAFRERDPKLREQMFKQAETHFQKAIALNPKATQTQVELAQMYTRVGRFDDAIAIYRRHVAADPDNPEATQRLAELYGVKRQIADSLGVWQRYRARKPSDPLSYDQMALLYEAQNNLAQAVVERRKRLDMTPDDGGTRLALARDYEQLKQPEQAKQQYREVAALDVSARDVPQARRGATQSDRQAWRRVAWRGLAQLADDASSVSEAAAYLNKIKADEAQAAKNPTQKPTPQIYFDLADLYQRHNQPVPAIQELRAATQAFPNESEPFLRLAKAYAAQHRVEEAAIAYRQAMPHTKDALDVGLQLAEMYRRENKPELALAEYDALRVTYPKEGRLLAAQGQALEAAGKDDRAYEVYVALGEADRSLNWVEDRKAIVLARLKRYPEARALREAQIERAPDQSQPYADLGRLYREEGRPEAFLAWLQARIQHLPAQSTPMVALLNAEADQKQEEAGWKFLQGVAAQHPGERPVQEAYARVMAQRGRVPEAVAIYRQTAQQNPTDDAPFQTLIGLLDGAGKKEEANGEYAARAALPGLANAQRVTLRRELATRLLNQNRLPEAIAQYQEILKLAHDDVNAQVLLAQTLAKNNQKAEAVTAYLQALALPDCPPDTRVYCLAELGSLYEQQGKKADALSRYREALKLDPQYPQAAQGLKRLGGS